MPAPEGIPWLLAKGPFSPLVFETMVRNTQNGVVECAAKVVARRKDDDDRWEESKIGWQVPSRPQSVGSVGAQLARAVPVPSEKCWLVAVLKIRSSWPTDGLIIEYQGQLRTPLPLLVTRTYHFPSRRSAISFAPVRRLCLQPKVHLNNLLNLFIGNARRCCVLSMTQAIT